MSPIGIDLTKEAVAQREKIFNVIKSKAEQYKQQKVSEANLYHDQKVSEAVKYKLNVFGDADMIVISKKAEAEQKSMELLGKAISSKDGQDIVKMKLAQQYLEEMKGI